MVVDVISAWCIRRAWAWGFAENLKVNILVLGVNMNIVISSRLWITKECNPAKDV
jgi:hypothetical protein